MRRQNDIATRGLEIAVCQGVADGSLSMQLGSVPTPGVSWRYVGAALGPVLWSWQTHCGLVFPTLWV
jgi:hypothetical protein